jgi:anti-sigma factor (TIGR02949 family)
MSETKIISCEEALRLLAEHLDGELDETRRDDVERHLSRCRGCYSRSEFEQRLKSRLGALRQEAVGPAFEERVRTLIGKFAAVPEV